MELLKKKQSADQIMAALKAINDLHFALDANEIDSSQQPRDQSCNDAASIAAQEYNA